MQVLAGIPEVINAQDHHPDLSWPRSLREQRRGDGYGQYRNAEMPEDVHKRYR